MVIGNEIAKMYDISGIASKVSQREYSFSTNENDGGIIKSSENNDLLKEINLVIRLKLKSISY